MLSGTPPTNCPAVTPLITANPFPTKNFYVLGSDALELPFDVLTIGNIEDDGNCGKPAIKIVLVSGSDAIDTTKFDADYDNQKFVVKKTSDLSAVGQTYFRFKYFNENDPANARLSSAFLVHIIDECNPPDTYPTKPVLTKPTLTNQQYTITEADKPYTIEPWTVTPVSCASQLVYEFSSVIPATGNKAIQFDVDTFTFSYSASDDLSGSTAAGTQYTVQVTAKLHTRTSSQTFVLTVKNPCFDTNYFSVTPAAELDEISYTVGESAKATQHDPFTIVASQAVKNICGGLSYTSQNSLGAAGVVSYAGTQMKHQVQTTDISHAGEHTYSVSSYLTKNVALGK